MKKIVIVLMVLIVIAAASVYLFIPAQLVASSALVVRCSERTAERFLGSENYWAKWWPGDKPYSYDGYSYSVIKDIPDFIGIGIKSRDSITASTVSVAPMGNDSCFIMWTCRMQTSVNPVKKLQQYFDAKHIKESMTDLLANAKKLLQNPDSVYGMHVIETTVKDTLLVSTKTAFKNYPSTQDLYSVINTLKNYVLQNNASITGNPMMYVSKQDTAYTLQVALPVNKELPISGAIAPKRMVPLKILVADVHGGTGKVNEAFHQMQNYVDDHGRESPAIPFISIVTDRMQETDTAKWISRIYYPVL